MARPRRAPSAFTITPAEGGEPQSDQSPTDQADDVLQDLEDEGQRPTEGRIHRLDPATRKLALLDTVDASVIDESYLRENYGGGEYAVYFWGPKKGGGWGYLKGAGKRFRIDSSIPFKGAPRDRATAPLSAPVQGSGAGGGGMGGIMEMGFMQLLKGMQDTSNMQAAMARDHSTAMMAMMERLSAPRDSGMGELKDIIRPLLENAINKSDPIETAARLIQAMKPEQSSHSGGLSALREFMEIKELIGGGNDNGDGGEGRWFSLAEKVIPGALDVIKGEAAKMAAANPPRALPPRPTGPRISNVPPNPRLNGSPPPAPPIFATTPTPMNPSDTAITSESPPVADDWEQLRPYVGYLVNFAAAGKDTFDTMTTIKTLAPPAMLEGVRALVESADDYGAALLCGRFPELQPYAEWVGGLVEDFYFDFHPEEDGDDDGEEPGVDGSTDGDGVSVGTRHAPRAESGGERPTLGDTHLDDGELR